MKMNEYESKIENEKEKGMDENDIEKRKKMKKNERKRLVKK